MFITFEASIWAKERDGRSPVILIFTYPLRTAPMSDRTSLGNSRQSNVKQAMSKHTEHVDAASKDSVEEDDGASDPVKQGVDLLIANTCRDLDQCGDDRLKM